MKKIYVYILAFASVFSASCADYLDRYPTDKPSSDSFLQSPEELELAVNNAYRTLYYMNSGCSSYLFLDAATDIERNRSFGDGLEDVALGNHTATTGVFKSTWNHFYTYISRCNNILTNLDNVKGITEVQKNEVKGQILFLRAFAYGELISLFGDVPYSEIMLQNVEEGKLPRTSKEEILNSIIEDLKESENSLPSVWKGNNAGKVTKWAAYALHARLSLRFGKYDEAVTASKIVMDNASENGIGLYESYEDLFNVKGVRCKEVLLDVPFHISVKTNENPLMLNPRNCNGWAIIQPTVSLVDSYECVDGKKIDESPLFEQSNPYKNRDPRLSASIIHDGTWYRGVRYETHPDSLLTTKIVSGVESRIKNQDVTNAYASHTGFLMRKYADYTALDVRKCTLNFILIRYAEVLLTYAEAKLEKGEIDQSLFDALNEVRNRVKMPIIIEKDPIKLRELIRNERKVELAGEGLRLFDIRRWKIAEYVMPGVLPGRKKREIWFNPGIPKIDTYGISHYDNQNDYFFPVHNRIFNPNRDYVWPIPQKEIDVNDKLVQNPNY